MPTLIMPAGIQSTPIDNRHQHDDDPVVSGLDQPV